MLNPIGLNRTLTLDVKFFSMGFNPVIKLDLSEIQNLCHMVYGIGSTILHHRGCKSFNSLDKALWSLIIEPSPHAS